MMEASCCAAEIKGGEDFKNLNAWSLMEVLLGENLSCQDYVLDLQTFLSAQSRPWPFPTLYLHKRGYPWKPLDPYKVFRQ